MAVFIVLIQNNELFKYVLNLNETKRIKSQNIQIQDITFLNCINNIDIVCFDKTGVLTTREIEVKRIHFADETPDIDSFLSGKNIFNLTNIACALCNDVIFFEKINQADPIDRALIFFALKNRIDINEIKSKYKRIYDKPFDSEDRYMACGFKLNDKRIYFAKGDPEIILKMCKSYITVSGIEKKMDLEFLLSFNAKTYSINQKGDRTIALAYSKNTLESPPLHYTFLCLLHLENPVKPGVPEVVKKLKEKGVRTIILTGDRPETAMKIGREIGIDNLNYCLTGKNIAQMELSEVARQSDHVSIFARLLPSQKGVLIMLMQQRKNIVAMVGDGANDAVAIKVADVGVSFVEKSSPFAKRVSKILVNDLDDLLTIIKSVRRVKCWIGYLMLFRALIFISMLLTLYIFSI